MKRFMALATSALTLTALFGLANTSFAQSNALRLIDAAGALGSGEFDVETGGFRLNLFYDPAVTGQVGGSTPNTGIRTTVVNSFLLFDDTKFTVTYTSLIAAAAIDGGPTDGQRNALAPTRNTISVLALGGLDELDSFDTPVDILGANPSGFINTLSLFDGDYTIPSTSANAAIPGLKFTAAGFLLGRYTFVPKSTTTYGDTVIGFAENLVNDPNALRGQEKANVVEAPNINRALTLSGVHRFAVVPAPSSVAVMALGGLVPLIALARRRRAAK